ncbi:BLUF domain-containing protein [Neotamlana laminarinivorans]|uniref:BLUF domain-containing protein n=1 Tax=Neotamlana laminarinivorans TaxID=2883124 RepID=A0A9X1I093_9FLAO|nr:BLUF domain-containing protein [Tamlana laminarinivorans]MCB4798816.1 BLUF domain-containing protein [Tamlana laminarinivorans]
MFKTICYLSDVRIKEFNETLSSFYHGIKQNNKKNNITGVLIHKDHNFLQVMEGETKQVDLLFEVIKKDKRHQNLFIIINTNTEQRIFEDYNFGFTIANSNKGLKDLYQYLEWLKTANSKDANRVILMVEQFINS